MVTGKSMGALIRPGNNPRSSACATVMNDSSSVIRIRNVNPPDRDRDRPYHGTARYNECDGSMAEIRFGTCGRRGPDERRAIRTTLAPQTPSYPGSSPSKTGVNALMPGHPCIALSNLSKKDVDGREKPVH